jgi:hypothetical protein
MVPVAMRHALRTIAAIALATATLYATTDWLTGTWRAEVHGEAKTFSVVLHFTYDGKKIGGSFEIPSHDLEFPISRGTVNGNEVSFEAAGPWHGKLEGKELKLTRELDGGKKQQMVAHRTAQ